MLILVTFDLEFRANLFMKIFIWKFFSPHVIISLSFNENLKYGKIFKKSLILAP